MLSKKEIENLRWVHYNIPDRERNSFISFIKGYLFAKDDKELEHYISRYLSQKYQINIEYTTLLEQIDHYAYNANKDILRGFCILLREIYDCKDEIKQQKGFEYRDDLKNKKEPIIKKPIIDGGIIKVGDIIKLGNTIKEDYKHSKFYNASLRNPSWDLFYPSFKDYKHLSFYFPEKNEMQLTYFGQVRRIFSNSVVKIKHLFLEDEKLIAYTNLFRIEVEKALEQREIEIIKSDYTEIDLTFLKDKVRNYTIGITEYMTLSELIGKWCFDNIPLFNKIWHNYTRDMNGNWCQIRE
ncbi:hypothetical protein [uncultured Aquimarina sp.]|uniref:hypothetical protein n=1 Tax=uncultured Aquimarina sp. TaxID=575652 RepID=UPI00261E0398|nr:hypothetical protein [uncultured Aquimarina sp.]